jgi:hypothetical protein
VALCNLLVGEHERARERAQVRQDNCLGCTGGTGGTGSGLCFR